MTGGGALLGCAAPGRLIPVLRPDGKSARGITGDMRRVAGNWCKDQWLLTFGDVRKGMGRRPVTAEVMEHEQTAWERRVERGRVREERLRLITAEAQKVELGHALLTLITCVLFGAAGLAGKVCRLWV